MIRIQVNGVPAPQGSKRHVGGGRMVESSKAVGPWREAVRAETQRQCATPIAAGPVDLTVVFWLPRPRGHYGVNGLRPSAPGKPDRRPDLDKLMRAVLDGIVAGGAIHDDAQIVILHAIKRYAGSGQPPGCLIQASEAD